MDNKEFDNLLGDKLGTEQSFDFQEPDWEDLSHKLDEAEGQKKRSPFWFWTGLMAVVVLGMVFFLWKELAETKKLVQILELNTTQNSVVVNDTIYNKITITQYDTIQKTVFIEKIEKRTSPVKQLTYKVENRISNFKVNKNKTGKEQNGFYKTAFKNQQYASSLTGTEDARVVDVLEKSQRAVRIEFRKKDLVQSQSEEGWKKKNFDLVLPEDLKVPANKIQKLPRKNRFKMGVLGAMYLPESQALLGYVPDGFFNQNSQAFGLRAEFELTNNFSITGDIAYQKTIFKTNDPSFIQPLVLEDEGLFGIDDLTINESNLSSGISIKYFLRKHRKIQPYTHLRLQVISSRKQKIRGVIPGTVYTDPTLYESEKKESGIDLESVETGLGFQYRFLQNLSWQAEGNYHFYLNELDDAYRSKIAFKTSLLFHF